MKKYGYGIILLSLMGAVVSGLLLWLDYNLLGIGQATSLCGGWLASQCGEVISQSEYATLWGFPFATYGLFFYSFILFMALATNYLGGRYLPGGFFILVSLVIMSVVADVFLARIMMSHNTFCFLCASTYLINLALLILFILLYKELKTEVGFSWRQIAQVFASTKGRSPSNKGIAVFFLMFVFLLFFAVFSTSYILRLQTLPLRQARVGTNQRVAEFYQQKPESLALPGSSLVIGKGSGKIQIITFTDFLCTYCYKIFELEQDIYEKYGDNVSFVYYNYPLDQDCNPYVERSVYPGSCTAAKAFVSAASLQIFQEYHHNFFSQYEKFHESYDADRALSLASGLVNITPFQQEMDSEATAQILRRDIELAAKLHIEGTPTLFINGRRIVGAPAREVLEMIIDRELKDSGN